MAKRKDLYLNAMGVGQETGRQNLPLDQWIVSKIPPAAGGLFAHEVYNLTTTKWFANLVPKYGRDIIGSLGLGIAAYVLDHNMNVLVWKIPNFSDDFTESFTDGMIGRGAPALFSAFQALAGKLSDWLTGKTSTPQKANAMLPPGQEYAPNLDDAPGALADMMSLLSTSPKTRQALTDDLLNRMAQRGVEVTPLAKTNIANCIGDLAESYKRA